MTIFELVFHFWSFRCASFDLEYKIQTFCIWSCQCTHQGGDCETKWFVPWFIFVMSYWLALVWIWIQWILVELTPNWVIRFGEMFFLISWCVGGECDMAGSDEDWGKSMRLGVEDQGWSITSQVLGGWTIGRSGDTVCDPHHTHGRDEKRGFPDLASKLVAIVCEWFGLKTTATVPWFGPQNQLVWCLSVCASKLMSGWRWCEDTRRHPVACFIVKQVGLGFPSFASKLVKERLRVVHVASSWRSCGGKAKDGRLDGIECGAAEVGPNYHSLDVIFLLAYRGILVFCFRYK
jgi:hypothetical protein